MTYVHTPAREAGFQKMVATKGWTPERVEVLKALWIKGESCAEIAKAIGGVTRNAVIGKAQRLGLGVKAGKIRQKTSPPTTKASTLKAPPVKRVPNPLGRATERIGLAGNGATFDRGEDRPPRVERIAFARAFQPLPGSEPRPWETRTFGECKWPIDGANGEALSCCRPCDGDRYCDTHTETSRPKDAKPLRPKPAAAPVPLWMPRKYPVWA